MVTEIKSLEYKERLRFLWGMARRDGYQIQKELRTTPTTTIIKVLKIIIKPFIIDDNLT